MPVEHCEVHRDEMAVIHDVAKDLTGVASDVKWIKKFGSVWMAVTGGAVVMMVPILIGFFVYLSKIESRLCVVEFKMGVMEKK